MNLKYYCEDINMEDAIILPCCTSVQVIKK